MKKIDVIIIDDDNELLNAQIQSIELAGYATLGFTNGLEAIKNVDRTYNGVILADVRMPNIDGFEVFKKIREIDDEIPVVLLTGHGDIAMAVSAIRDGVYDFISKPFESATLLLTIQRAINSRKLILENRQLRQLQFGADPRAPQIIGNSIIMEKLKQNIQKVSEIDLNLHIWGEIGTEKEMIAKAIHFRSDRKTKPFIHVNGNSFDDGNFVSEFFGLEAGVKYNNKLISNRRSIGLFEKLGKGVLLFEGIEKLSHLSQEKFALVLERSEFYPIGAIEPRKVEFRLLTSSELDIGQLHSQGLLINRLFYQLGGLSISVPNLRERTSDIPILFQKAVSESCARHKRPIPPFDPNLIAQLRIREWPGNTIELNQFAELYALGLADTAKSIVALNEKIGLQKQVAEFERHLIEETLRLNKGSVKNTIEILELPRKTFYDKVSKLGININSFRVIN